MIICISSEKKQIVQYRRRLYKRNAGRPKHRRLEDTEENIDKKSHRIVQDKWEWKNEREAYV